MLLEKFLICGKCKKLIPINEVRADSFSSDWICLECYTSQHKRLQKTYMNVSRVMDEKRVIITPYQSARVKMRCSRCAYVFLISEDKIPALCPYCGREETLTRE